MPIYDDRSIEKEARRRREGERWRGEVEARRRQEIGSQPYPEPHPAARSPAPAPAPLPKAQVTWGAQPLAFSPSQTPLQRKARLGLHWAALEHRHAQDQDAAALAAGLEARRGKGTPLPAELHERLEAHLGSPLPKIVIHADAEAHALAEELQAEAFTLGQEIFFRQGAYDPHSPEGQKLLAHEATHVLQQSRGLARAGIDADVGLEAQARQVEQGFSFSSSSSSSFSFSSLSSSSSFSSFSSSPNPQAQPQLQQPQAQSQPQAQPQPQAQAQAQQPQPRAPAPLTSPAHTPRTLQLLPGLVVQLPAAEEERRWLDEGSALALRNRYRGIAQRLTQAYRQGLRAGEVAQAIHTAEAATGLPLLEAVLTFLGRAEGLKASLIQAYRGEEPQPAVAQASPALQRKPLKPQEIAELNAAQRQLQRVNRQMALEIAGIMADVAGVVDPTPISDGISAAISLARGDFVGTGLSLVSMLPYVGDAAAKSAKGARALERLRSLVHQAEQAMGVIRRLDPAGVRQAEATLATLTEKVRNVLKYRSVRVTADHIRRLGDDVLDEMEKLGGHLLAKHVGKKDQELIQRAIREGVEAASTFPNKATATRAVLENIRSHADKIVEWLDNKVKLPDQPLRLEFEHSFEVGRSVQEGSKRVQGGLKKSVLILKKAPDKPLGFYILTGFPSAK